jgi:hypothetical protein
MIEIRRRRRKLADREAIGRLGCACARARYRSKRAERKRVASATAIAGHALPERANAVYATRFAAWRDDDRGAENIEGGSPKAKRRGVAAARRFPNTRCTTMAFIECL